MVWSVLMVEFRFSVVILSKERLRIGRLGSEVVTSLYVDVLPSAGFVLSLPRF